MKYSAAPRDSSVQVPQVANGKPERNDALFFLPDVLFSCVPLV